MKGKKGFQPGTEHWNYSGDEASYFARHDRCTKARGKASQHRCVKCAENEVSRKAKDWALIHGESGLDPWTDFVPLCRGCHLKYDYTQERRDKKSAALKGKPWSEARHAAHRPWRQSEEAKAKISAARRKAK